MEAQDKMSWDEWQKFCYIKDVKLGRIKVQDGDFHLKPLNDAIA